MAVEAARIVINVSAEGTDKAASGLGKVDDSLKKSEQSAKGFSDAIKTAATALGLMKLAQIAGDAIAAGVSFNKAAEQARISFEVMTGSVAEADKTVRALKDFAAKTPFSFQDIQSATMTLMNFGVEARRAVELTKMLGDASGGNAERMNRLALAFGKASAQGKLTGEVVQQMIDAGFNPLTEIAKITGEAMGDLQKRMSAGKVSSDELSQAFVAATSAGGRFYGMLERQSQSLVGLQSTMNDAFATLGGAITEGLTEPLKIATAGLTVLAQVMTEGVNLFNQLPEPIKIATTVIGALTAAVVTLAVAEASGIAMKIREIAVMTGKIALTVKDTIVKWANVAAEGALTVAKWAQYAAQMAVNAALAVTNPLLWAYVAVAAAAATWAVVVADGLNDQSKATDTAAKSTSKYTDRFNDLYRAAKRWNDLRVQMSPRQELQQQAEATYRTHEEYVKRITELNQRMIQTRTLERAGILTKEESLRRLLEIEEDILQTTIDTATQQSNRSPYVTRVRNSRESIEKMKKQLDELKDKSNEVTITTEETRRDQLKKTLDYFNSINEGYAQTQASQFEQTMEMLNGHFDVIEDENEIWIESLERIKEEYETIFNMVSGGLGSIASIADNVGRGNIMRLEEEEARRRDLDERTIEGMLARGATEQEISDARAVIDAERATREKDLNKQKKQFERDAAIRAKAFAVFEATLKLPLLIMQGIAQPFPFGGAIGGAIYGGLGALQLASATSTPIPSAQFGGEFMVPPGYQGDSGLLRVNSGERVSVEPVRASSNEGQKKMTVTIGGRDFEGYLDEVLNSGRITIRRKGVVRYA